MQKKYVAIILLFFFLISMISILGSPLAVNVNATASGYTYTSTGTSDSVLYKNTFLYWHTLANDPNIAIKFESTSDFKIKFGSAIIYTGQSVIINYEFLIKNNVAMTTNNLQIQGTSGSAITATIVSVDTTEIVEKVVVSSSTQQHTSSQANELVYLYLDETTPLTVKYFISNPDFVVNVSSPNSMALYSGNSSYIAPIYGSISLSTDVFIDSYNASPNLAKWSQPIAICAYKTGYMTQINVSTSTITVPDETDPTDPDHGGSGTDIEEDDNSGLISGIVDGIGSIFDELWNKIVSFCTNLFQPVIDYIEEWNEKMNREDSAKDTIFDALGIMWDKLMGYTMEPIKDFFHSVLNVEAIALVMSFWEIPILKEFAMAAVVVLVIIAFFILATTI